MDFRKILLVSGFILAVILMGLAIYWVFFREPNIPANNPDLFNPGGVPNIGNGGITPVDVDGQEQENLPIQVLIDQNKVSTVANGGLTLVNKITDAPTKGLATGNQGLQYYDQEKQQFYRIGADGKPTLLSEQKFFGVDKVTWDASSDKAIIEYPDGNNILYDFKQNKQITLPAEMEEFSFSRSGDKISAAWIGDTEDNNWVVTANADGSGLRLIEPLGDQAYNTEIGYSPDGQVVALHRKNTGLNQQEIYPIGLNNENYPSFVVQGAGFTSSWSPSGNSLIYSVYNETTDYLPNLWVTEGNSGEIGTLKVSLNVATWPDKCTFSGESTLYCAVPQGLPRGAGLYPEVADTYTDNFYRLDLNTGLKTLLASPIGSTGGYTAYNLRLSPDGSVLYFTDRQTGALQSINLE